MLLLLRCFAVALGCLLSATLLVPPVGASTPETRAQAPETRAQAPETRARAPEPRAAIITPGQVVLDDFAPGEHGLTIHDLEGAARRSAQGQFVDTGLAPSLTTVGGFVACYGSAVPDDVKVVVERALDAWSSVLLLDGPAIEVDVIWTSFSSPTALAASGPVSFVQGPELPRPEFRYPVALANQLLGIDHAPRARCDSSVGGEAVLYLNSAAGGDGSLWHLVDDPPPADKIDLQGVIIHEIAHALGFLSSARVDGAGQRWPHDGGSPYIYDSFFRRCDTGGECRRDTAAPVGVGDTSRLDGDDLWFAAPHAPLLQLYAPPGWQAGSSTSHFDEARYGPASTFALMSPFMSRGEDHDVVDNATLTAMQALGWPLAGEPPTPFGLTANAGDATATLDLRLPPLEEAPAPQKLEVSIWRNGSYQQAMTIPGVPVDLSGLLNGSSYEFTVRSIGGSGASAHTDRTAAVVPLELPPFATAESFVQHVFDHFLGRQPTPAELRSWSRASRAADTLAEVVDQFVDAPAIVRQLRLARLYLGFFDRIPDRGGLDYWIGQGERGESLERIALQFARASEFEQGKAVSDRQFVTAAYQRLLGRAPDPGGIDYWVGRLGAGLDRGRLLLLFSESPEHLGAAETASEVIIVFRAVIDRLPSGQEVRGWTPVVRGDGRRELITQLMNHPEFLALVPAVGRP